MWQQQGVHHVGGKVLATPMGLSRRGAAPVSTIKKRQEKGDAGTGHPFVVTDRPPKPPTLPSHMASAE